MKLTPKIQKAINIATEKHHGQSRKGKEIPYIVHPFSVALILSEYTHNEDIIAAGLMHDVLEDVRDYNFDDLKNDLGEKIARIVREVSEDIDPNMEDPKTTWDYRKHKYLEDLKTESYEAMMITAAEFII
jgi:(p)ppGpp synthase/HD superfamily hydrolase